MRLYDLSSQYNKVNELLEESDDIELLQDTLDSLDDAFDMKVESIIKLFKSKCAERDAIDDEKKRLSERSARIDKQAEWLKTYVEDNMKAMNKTEVKSILFSIKLQSNPPKVLIADGVEINEKYLNTKITVTPNKALLKQAIDAGEVIEGVTVVQEQSIRIK